MLSIRRNVGDPPEHVAQLRRALSLDALTIGFARRFATYKRADLIIQDIETFLSLVGNPRMPVQFVFAGKSHPHRSRQVRPATDRSADSRRTMSGKVVFMRTTTSTWAGISCRASTCGSITPDVRSRRVAPADKVVLNGGLNLSILDGWWAEAYDGLNGFAIGMGETHSSMELRDARDAEALRRVLLDTVVPLYTSGIVMVSARMDRTNQASHPHAGMALQRRSHGEGLRVESVHPRGGWHEQRCQSVLEQFFRLEDDENAQTEDQAHSCKQPIEKCDRRGDRWPGPVVS